MILLDTTCKQRSLDGYDTLRPFFCSFIFPGHLALISLLDFSVLSMLPSIFALSSFWVLILVFTSGLFCP